MSGSNPVNTNGLVVAGTKPVEVAVGAGEPHGKAKTSHALATLLLGFTGCVHAKLTLVDVTAELTTAVGLLQVGGGAHVTLATHPGLFIIPSLLNTKVKHPLRLDAVKGPGIAVPQ